LDFLVGFVAASERADGVVQRRLAFAVERAELGGAADFRERFAPDDPLPDAAESRRSRGFRVEGKPAAWKRRPDVWFMGLN